MNIKCMAVGTDNKGVIPHEECLACALKNGNNVPCKFDYSVLAYIYKKGGLRYKPKSIHVSDLLQCKRKSYFTKTIEMPLEPQKELITSYGTIQHGFLEKVSQKDKNIVPEQQLEGLGITGQADLVYLDGKRLVDYKTTRNITPRYLPKKEHKLQLNIYAYLLNNSGTVIEEAAIQYIDFLGPSKCDKCHAFVIPTQLGIACPVCNNLDKNYHLGAVLVPVKLETAETVRDIIDSGVKYLERCLENHETPVAEPSFLCRYCSYINMCQEGLKTL